MGGFAKWDTNGHSNTSSYTKASVFGATTQTKVEMKENKWQTVDGNLVQQLPPLITLIIDI